MGQQMRPPKIYWRIRALKPEIHHDRALAMAERKTGLPVIRVYQGLWGAADRRGRFPWLPDELQRNILPWDADRWPIEDVLAVLIEGGWLVRYEANGLAWGWVPRLGEHQRFNAREADSLCPAPPQAVVDAWTAAWRPEATGPGAGAPAGDPNVHADADTDLHVQGQAPAGADTCAHVHARACTCNAPLGTRNLEQEGGTQGCQPTAAPPAAAVSPPPEAFGEGGEACHGPARKRQRPPAETSGPLDAPATAAQLETLAAMAAERGTTLAREATAAGVPAPIRKRDVTGLRHRLEALPRLKPDQPAGGRAVLWSDVRQLLDANEPAKVAELLDSLPVRFTQWANRGELWRKVEQHCRDLLPRDVDLQALLDAAGVESVRQDLPRVWALVLAVRGGNRSMFPPDWPESAEGERARLLVPKIAWHIENHGNGNRPELRERLNRLAAARDSGGIGALADELGVEACSR